MMEIKSLGCQSNNSFNSDSFRDFFVAVVTAI